MYILNILLSVLLYLTALIANATVPARTHECMSSREFKMTPMAAPAHAIPGYLPVNQKYRNATSMALIQTEQTQIPIRIEFIRRTLTTDLNEAVDIWKECKL